MPIPAWRRRSSATSSSGSNARACRKKVRPHPGADGRGGRGPQRAEEDHRTPFFPGCVLVEMVMDDEIWQIPGQAHQQGDRLPSVVPGTPSGADLRGHILARSSTRCPEGWTPSRHTRSSSQGASMCAARDGQRSPTSTDPVEDVVRQEQGPGSTRRHGLRALDTGGTSSSRRSRRPRVFGASAHYAFTARVEWLVKVEKPQGAAPSTGRRPSDGGRVP